MIIWNGYNVHLGELYGDGARYNPATDSWAPVAAAGAPDARRYHTAVWTGTEMIVWGGANEPAYDRQRRPLQPGDGHLDAHQPRRRPVVPGRSTPRSGPAAR